MAIVLILIIIGSVLFNMYSPWWFTPLASNWSEMDDTLIITLWITGAVFIAIVLFIAYSVFRFRYQKGRRAAYEPENARLELWLIGLTTVGVAAMLAPGLIVYAKIIDVPKDASVVEAVGQQWRWSFRFPGDDGVLGATHPRLISFKNPFGMKSDDPNGQDDILINGSEVHFPIDKPIHVLLRSKDVLHDFYVPNFRIKMDLVPGIITSLWLTPTRPGKYNIACAEYCGVGHHTMRGSVVVEEEAEFLSWLDAQPTFAQASAQPAASEDNPLIEQGRELAADQGCLGCHSVDGSSSVGPTWKDLYGKTETLSNGSTVKVDADYLKESILNPNAKIVQGYSAIMPAYELSEEEINALIAYAVAQSSAGGKKKEVDASTHKGQDLAAEQGCLSCHSVDGSKMTGPTWKGLWGSTKTLANGDQVTVDKDYLKVSILDPKAMVVKGYSPIMPPYQVSDEELGKLVSYIRTLSD